jgi:DNA-binding response OmpR family regulator
MASGADEYMTKPIDVAAFMALVGRLLGSSR